MKAELLDYMGDDLAVVNAARVSFDKESDWEWYGDDNGGVEGLCDKDEKLINYLAKHNHWTPFSHVIIKIHETVPIFVARQRFKHTVGFTYNEVSRRYVDDEPEFYYPKRWRGRPVNAKQGSDGLVDDPDFCHKAYKQSIQYALDTYNHLLEDGAAPEQARMVLPQSMYTSYIVTGSLAAWVRAYKLRSDTHAQEEIQNLSQKWNEIIQPLFPVSWKALTEN